MGLTVFWGIKKLTERGGSGPSSSVKQSPLDIAKERYAKGEISKKQSEQNKKDLSQPVEPSNKRVWAD